MEARVNGAVHVYLFVRFALAVVGHAFRATGNISAFLKELGESLVGMHRIR